MSDSSSSSPKPLPKSEPLLPPKVIHKRTLRMRTGGKVPLKQLATPFRQQPAPAQAPLPIPLEADSGSQQEPWWNLSSETSEDDSEDDSDPEDDSEDDKDPEDDPDNDFEYTHKRKRLRRYFSSDLADESDEEELGDQDRQSPRDIDANGRDYNIATSDGDDSNF